MALSKKAFLELAHLHWESFRASRAKALLLQKWERGEQYEIDEPDSVFHGQPYQPRRGNANVSQEYENLAQLAPSAFAGLVVKAVSQTAQVEGIRMPKQRENLEVWETFQRNRWAMRQDAIHRDAVAKGIAYGSVLPGVDPFTGDDLARMRGYSATEMAAWYEEDDDEWPRLALHAIPAQIQSDGGVLVDGWIVKLFDEDSVHTMQIKGDGWTLEEWEYVTFEDHGMRVVPIARCTNRLDLDGRTFGEIEPVLPLLRRIDQDVFDRLIVQRFGAWKVRYATGLAKPSTQEQANIQAMKLMVEDLLVAGDPNAKFGTLDGSDPGIYSKITDDDLRMLSAITQLPPHHLLGLSSNLQAEALAAAEAGLQRKSKDFRTSAGEFHRQMARMAATINGNATEAAAWDMQITWADTESRSLNQAADALGKMAVQLKVPVEMLWEKIPGWTDTDVERAKELIESGDAIDAVIAELLNQPPDPAQQGTQSQQEGQSTGGDEG